MARKHDRTAVSILAGASEGFWRENPSLGAALAGAKPKQSQLDALGGKREGKTGMVDLTCPIFVVITRRGKKKLDYDNLVGGCKRLRDAIAEDLFGLKGDDDKDGITFEYRQELSRETTETLVEVFK